MEYAKTLVHDYVRAGFTKIHIDTSMKVADDDPNTRLSDETIARHPIYPVSNHLNLFSLPMMSSASSYPE